MRVCNNEPDLLWYDVRNDFSEEVTGKLRAKVWEHLSWGLKKGNPVRSVIAVLVIMTTVTKSILAAEWREDCESGVGVSGKSAHAHPCKSSVDEERLSEWLLHGSGE